MNVNNIYPITTDEHIRMNNGKSLRQNLGSKNGIATLDNSGKVPQTQLPSLSGMAEYDNTQSGLEATTVQGAIDELALNGAGGESWTDVTELPEIEFEEEEITVTTTVATPAAVSGASYSNIGIPNYEIARVFGEIADHITWNRQVVDSNGNFVQTYYSEYEHVATIAEIEELIIPVLLTYGISQDGYIIPAETFQTTLNSNEFPIIKVTTEGEVTQLNLWELTGMSESEITAAIEDFDGDNQFDRYEIESVTGADLSFLSVANSFIIHQLTTTTTVTNTVKGKPIPPEHTQYRVCTDNGNSIFYYEDGESAEIPSNITFALEQPVEIPENTTVIVYNEETGEFSIGEGSEYYTQGIYEGTYSPLKITYGDPVPTDAEHHLFFKLDRSYKYYLYNQNGYFQEIKLEPEDSVTALEFATKYFNTDYIGHTFNISDYYLNPNTNLKVTVLPDSNLYSELIQDGVTYQIGWDLNINATSSRPYAMIIVGNYEIRLDCVPRSEMPSKYTDLLDSQWQYFWVSNDLVLVSTTPSIELGDTLLQFLETYGSALSLGCISFTVDESMASSIHVYSSSGASVEQQTLWLKDPYNNIVGFDYLNIGEPCHVNSFSAYGLNFIYKDGAYRQNGSPTWQGDHDYYFDIPTSDEHFSLTNEPVPMGLGTRTITTTQNSDQDDEEPGPEPMEITGRYICGWFETFCSNRGTYFGELLNGVTFEGYTALPIRRKDMRYLYFYDSDENLKAYGILHYDQHAPNYLYNHQHTSDAGSSPNKFWVEMYILDDEFEIKVDIDNVNYTNEDTVQFLNKALQKGLVRNSTFRVTSPTSIATNNRIIYDWNHVQIDYNCGNIVLPPVVNNVQFSNSTISASGDSLINCVFNNTTATLYHDAINCTFTDCTDLAINASLLGCKVVGANGQSIDTAFSHTVINLTNYEGNYVNPEDTTEYIGGVYPPKENSGTDFSSLEFLVTDTDLELNDGGEFAIHADLSGFATKSDLTDFATKSEIPEEFKHSVYADSEDSYYNDESQPMIWGGESVYGMTHGKVYVLDSELSDLWVYDESSNIYGADPAYGILDYTLYEYWEDKYLPCGKVLDIDNEPYIGYYENDLIVATSNDMPVAVSAKIIEEYANPEDLIHNAKLAIKLMGANDAYGSEYERITLTRDFTHGSTTYSANHTYEARLTTQYCKFTTSGGYNYFFIIPEDVPAWEYLWNHQNETLHYCKSQSTTLSDLKSTVVNNCTITFVPTGPSITVTDSDDSSIEFSGISSLSNPVKDLAWVDVTPSSGGGGSADLSNYYTKSQVDLKISTALNDYPTTSTMNTALAGKVSTESGKGLSTNDYTNADKAKVETIAPNIVFSVMPDVNDFANGDTILYVGASGLYKTNTIYKKALLDVWECKDIDSEEEEWDDEQEDYVYHYTYYYISQDNNNQKVYDLDGNLVDIIKEYNNPTYIGFVKDGGDCVYEKTSNNDYGIYVWQAQPSTSSIQESIIAYRTMPTASKSLVGQIYRYIGETTPAFTKGKLYQCAPSPKLILDLGNGYTAKAKENFCSFDDLMQYAVINYPNGDLKTCFDYYENNSPVTSDFVLDNLDWLVDNLGDMVIEFDYQYNNGDDGDSGIISSATSPTITWNEI